MMVKSLPTRRRLTVAVGLATLVAAAVTAATAVRAEAPRPTGAVVVPVGPGTTNLVAAPAAAPAKTTATPDKPAAPAGGANQTLPGGKDNKQPVDIQADNAIEWHQDQLAYVARGNASALRGNTTVYADVLTAYYRETKDKGNDVYRMTAEGNVHIISPSQQIFGEHGVWDNDKQVGIMTGQGLKLVTTSDIVVARDSLEYYDGTKLAVARGDAIAVRNQDRMRADTLIALFKDDGKGGTVLDRLDGIGNVLITTPTDVATCKRVMYSASSDIAVLVDDVKITRNDDQVNGDAAEMNMKTHVNRVLSGGRRVEGLLIPQDQNKQDATGKKTPAKTAAATPAGAPAAAPVGVRAAAPVRPAPATGPGLY